MNQDKHDINKSNDVDKVKSERTIGKSSWKIFLRQLIICSSVWSGFFTTGLSLGGPTVIIPQLRREANSTDIVSEEMVSWISSVHGYASLPWFILPIVSGYIGRKYTYFSMNMTSLVSFIVLYLCVTPTQILIAEIFQGPLFAGQITISVMIVAEYSSPKYRGLFLTLKIASASWGMLVANMLGTFVHWKNIAVVGIVCSIYNVLLMFFMCESPSWLASKHRYEECLKVNKWLKGECIESENEVKALIDSCKNYQEKHKTEMSIRSISKSVYKTVIDKAFFKPILLSIGTLSLQYASGGMIFQVYAIDVIKNVTSDESTAYIGMLILDSISVITVYVTSCTTIFFNRRTLLLRGSCGGLFFISIISLYLYLIKFKIVDENKYLCLVLLALYKFCLNIGPEALCTSIYGELLPLRYKTAGMFLVGLYTNLTLGISLKTAPFLFRTLDTSGAFLFYAALSAIIVYLLYKFLPETKGKSLQDIEDFFVNPIVEKNKETH